MKTIIHLFDIGIANSWILYRDDKKQLGDSSKSVLTFLDYKISVADYLLKDTNADNATTLINKDQETFQAHHLELPASQVRSKQLDICPS